MNSKYFSNNFFARDIIFSTSTFIVFLIGLVIAFDFESVFYNEFKAFIGGQGFISLFIAVLPGFIVVSTVSGFSSTGAFLVLRDLRFKLLNKDLHSHFDLIYLENKQEIAELYKMYFSALPYIKPHKKSESSEKNTRLIHLFKQLNPDGYVGVYREFSIVTMYRQLSVYSAIVLIASISRQNYYESIGLVILLIFFIFSESRSISQTVQEEYAFIMGSAAKLEIEHDKLLTNCSNVVPAKKRPPLDSLKRASHTAAG